MGLDGPPTEVRVTRWPHALPQFRVGHLQRVQHWRTELATSTPGVVVTGAGFEGLGIPACIRQGRVAAKTLIDQQF